MKTVKVHIPTANVGYGSDRRIPQVDQPSTTDKGVRYRLGHRPVGSQKGIKPCYERLDGTGRRIQLNVQSGHDKPKAKGLVGESCLCDHVALKTCAWEAEST